LLARRRSRMGDAQKSSDSVLGRSNFGALGRSHPDQLWRTLRRRHSVALASRCKWKRRLAYWRHNPGSTRSALCQFHAQLSEPDSSRHSRHRWYSRNNRTVLVRADLGCVVESERSREREGSRCEICRTLPAVDLSLGYSCCSHPPVAGSIAAQLEQTAL